MAKERKCPYNPSFIDDEREKENEQFLFFSPWLLFSVWNAFSRRSLLFLVFSLLVFTCVFPAVFLVLVLHTRTERNSFKNKGPEIKGGKMIWALDFTTIFLSPFFEWKLISVGLFQEKESSDHRYYWQSIKFWSFFVNSVLLYKTGTIPLLSSRFREKYLRKGQNWICWQIRLLARRRIAN